MWVGGRGSSVCVCIKAKDPQASAILSGFIWEGWQKWLGPGDLDKFTAMEKDVFLEGKKLNYFSPYFKNHYFKYLRFLNVCVLEQSPSMYFPSLPSFKACLKMFRASTSTAAFPESLIYSSTFFFPQRISVFPFSFESPQLLHSSCPLTLLHLVSHESSLHLSNLPLSMASSVTTASFCTPYRN